MSGIIKYMSPKEKHGPIMSLIYNKKLNRFYLLSIFCKGADALAMVSNTFMVAGVLLLLESCQHNQNTKDCSQ